MAGAGRFSVSAPFSHNTLTINHQLHRADGDARITHFSDDAKNAGAIVDLTPVFDGQATRVQRGFAFRPNRHLMIRDEIEGLKTGDTVRWAMLTSANIEIAANGQSAILTQNGKTLRVSLTNAPDTKFETISADPPRETDAPNPNSRFLIVNFAAPRFRRAELFNYLATRRGYRCGNQGCVVAKAAGAVDAGKDEMRLQVLAMPKLNCSRFRILLCRRK